LVFPKGVSGFHIIGKHEGSAVGAKKFLERDSGLSEDVHNVDFGVFTVWIPELLEVPRPVCCLDVQHLFSRE